MLFELGVSILGILLTILIVVGVHEGAHFWMAKMLGVKVLRFSIGFGKALFTWRDKSGTEYVFAPIPLGGYVKLLDEHEGPVASKDLHLAYNRQALYKRMLIVLAGPFSNLISAALLYWLIFVIGFKTFTPLIGAVEPRSIAAEAGVRAQTEIVAVDSHPVRSWPGIAMRLIAHTGNQDTVSITTQGAKQKAQTVHMLNLEHWQMSDLKPDP